LIRALAERIEFYKTVLYVVQGFFVAWYIGVYIYNYVPDSMFRQAVDAVEEYKSELRQQKRNDKALECLADTHVEIYDDIEREGERVTVYLCHDSEKVVIRYCDLTAGREDYCVADISDREGAEPDSIIKYRRLENGNTVLRESDDVFYLGVGANRYLCLERQDLLVHYEENRYTHVGTVYFDLLNLDVMDNTLKYLPNDIMLLEIVEEDMVCRITEESFRQLPVTEEGEGFAYGWTILRNGQEVLSRGIQNGEYTLNLRELPEEYWNQTGMYEIYLHTYFSSDRYDNRYRGDIKASNSVTWENTE